MPPGLRCFNRALRLFALSRELLELTARFFEERERPSLSLIDLADEPLFQLQAREFAEGLHSLATQARGLFESRSVRRRQAGSLDCVRARSPARRWRALPCR